MHIFVTSASAIVATRPFGVIPLTVHEFLKYRTLLYTTQKPFSHSIWHSRMMGKHTTKRTNNSSKSHCLKGEREGNFKSNFFLCFPLLFPEIWTSLNFPATVCTVQCYNHPWFEKQTMGFETKTPFSCASISSQQPFFPYEDECRVVGQ